jgi:hypothetical protein
MKERESNDLLFFINKKKIKFSVNVFLFTRWMCFLALILLEKVYQSLDFFVFDLILYYLIDLEVF